MTSKAKYQLVRRKYMIGSHCLRLNRSNRNSKNNGASGSLKDLENSVKFVSDKYDDLQAFQKTATARFKELSASLNDISKKVNDLAQAIDNLEAYSCQYNLKLVGIPELPDETAMATTELCAKIFQKIGASVSINDIDIAHRVPKRPARNQDTSSSYNAIICKFTRRSPIEEIMQQRNRISTIDPSEVDLPQDALFTSPRIFEQLTPKLQQLLYESKKRQQRLKFKFCWAKGGAVPMRATETSHIFKLYSMDDFSEAKIWLKTVSCAMLWFCVLIHALWTINCIVVGHVCIVRM